MKIIKISGKSEYVTNILKAFAKQKITLKDLMTKQVF